MQAIHRHIPIFVRALGSSYSELLHIISNPPQGSENLLTQVHIYIKMLTVTTSYYNHHQKSFMFHQSSFSCTCTDALYFVKVLNVLSEGTVPSADLVATVRRLYETKLKVFHLSST